VISGNGLVVDCYPQDGAWVVEFMSEPRTSPQALWFHLECSATEPAAVRFVWLNADSCLGLGRREDLENVRPVLCMDGGRWLRASNVAVELRGSGGHILTFATDASATTVSAAFCYPYGPDELHDTLSEVKGTWSEEPIGVTGRGRLLPRLRAERAEPVAGAYVVTRQHAGETPGSWVLDGLLGAVSGAVETDPLRQIEWWVVPFVDLDGVIAGDYGKDAMPRDFNRSWAMMPMRPEVQAIQRDMWRFAGRCARRMVLDLHAPGGGERAVYQFLPRDDRPDEQKQAGAAFTPRLAAELPEIPPDSLARVPRYPSRWTTGDTATTWSWDHLDGTTGVSIETAYQGPGQGPWFEPDDYRRIGAAIARAVAAHLTAS
jgi:hypothetical protein